MVFWHESANEGGEFINAAFVLDAVVRCNFHDKTRWIESDLFTNPDEKEGDSPNLDQAHAIIQEDQGNGSNIAVGFVIIDELTGVKTIKNIDSSEGDFWYTIQGVKVEHPTKGVYIHNNRKVVIK